MGHGIIAWIIIGIVAGWITGKLMKGSGFGAIMDMVVGLVGALIGGFLSSHLGFGGVGQHGLIVSIFIAVALSSSRWFYGSSQGIAQRIYSGESAL